MYIEAHVISLCFFGNDMLTEKFGMLVYAQEGFSSSNIINIEHILEGVHLWGDIFTLCNECTILELI